MAIPENFKKWFSTLKKWTYKLFKCGTIDSPLPPDKDPDSNENDIGIIEGNHLLNDMLALFKDSIKRMSIGEKLVYPMSFYIIIHKDDYEEIKQLLPIWTPEIIRNFYEILKQKQEQEGYTNCKPISKKWVFRYSPCRITSINITDDDIFTVSKGNIVKTAELYNDVIDRTDDISVERNIKVSIKCNNSDIIKTANLNLSALDGIEILEEGFFTYKYDDKYMAKPSDKPTEGPPQEPEITEDNKPLATISYEDNHHKYTYTMKMSPIYISSIKDTRTTSNILKINNPNLKNGHVQIKYEQGRFFLCAFGETRLNERPVKLSEPGNIIWVDLYNNSDILMNGDIQVKFKKA